MADRGMLGQVLKAYRQKNDIGTRELAATLGVSAATLNRIEHGFPMDAKTMIKFINWLFPS